MNTCHAPDYLDPPFLAPLECALDLPAPPSVNRTHRIDWRARMKKGAHTRWVHQADMRVLLDGGIKRLTKMPAAFELTIILDSTTKLDLDNSAKILCDYLKRLEVIVDDDVEHMRRLVIERGDAPRGCRLIVRSIA